MDPMARALSSIIRKSPMTRRTSEKKLLLLFNTISLNWLIQLLRRMLFLPEDGPMSASSFQFFAISLVQTERYSYIFTTALAYGPRTDTMRHMLGSGGTIWHRHSYYDPSTSHIPSSGVVLFTHIWCNKTHTQTIPTTYTYYHPRPLHESDWESDILISRSTSSWKRWHLTSYTLYLELLLRPDDADALLLLLLPLLSAMILLFALIVKC